MPVILEDHRIAYFNIPKAASTSIKHAFYRIEHGRPFQPGDQGAQYIHQIYRVELPVTAADYDRFDDYWTFTVVRDPAKRILSAYSNRVLHHKDMHDMRRARLRALVRGLSLTPDIETFLKKIDRYRAFSPSICEHTDRIDRFVGPDLSRLDRVYRIAELPRLTEDLSERVGRRVEIPHLQTGGPKIPLESLSRAGFDRLMAFTASEYELVREYYQPPERVTEA